MSWRSFQCMVSPVPTRHAARRCSLICSFHLPLPRYPHMYLHIYHEYCIVHPDNQYPCARLRGTVISGHGNPPLNMWGNRVKMCYWSKTKIKKGLWFQSITKICFKSGKIKFGKETHFTLISAWTVHSSRKQDTTLQPHNDMASASAHRRLHVGTKPGWAAIWWCYHNDRVLVFDNERLCGWWKCRWVGRYSKNGMYITASSNVDPVGCSCVGKATEFNCFEGMSGIALTAF